MHFDLDQCDATRPSQNRFCIIGAGVAGLILAKRLTTFGLDVLLLEAGGLQIEEQSQALFQAEMAAADHMGASLGRFRTFGGSSTRWGGQLLPYTSDVFESVQNSESAGWPIRETDIAGYYDEVQQIMNAGKLPFTEELLPALGHPTQPFSNQIRLRFSKWAPFSKRNLARTIGRECLNHPRIRVYTHAHVAELYVAGNRVTHLRVLNSRGRSFEFGADYFVVAAGTIESSRLLLSSAAISNRHDQLGRYFHDHVSFHAAHVSPAARRKIIDRLGPFFVRGVLHTCKIEATPELQRERGLLAVMAHFAVQEPEDSGIASTRNLLRAIQHRNFGQALARNFLPMLRGMGDVLDLLWCSKVLKRRAVSERAIVYLNVDMEQSANSANRIRLSANRDALGLQKVIVDWRVGDAEYETASKFVRIIKNEFELAGFPPLDWMPGPLQGTKPVMADTYHPMGGLRMGLDPATSVVDANLKVHGLDNLHVASCAVYPSGGSSNPTFTLMALSLRLADYLGKPTQTPSYSHTPELAKTVFATRS